MNLELRLERPEDYRRVEELTREAFWPFGRPACNEHYLVHLLRKVPAFVPELDYVAVDEGKLVGNIIYSRAKVVDSKGAPHPLLTFGPLSVLPEYWNRGVGRALVERTKILARELGYPGIVIYGHPDYYPRFGFRNAEVYGITTPQGKNFDALMALPLFPEGLEGISGAFYEDPVFELDPDETAAFDQGFPPKEAAQMIPVEILLAKVSVAAGEAIIRRGIKDLAAFRGYSGREVLGWEGVGPADLAVINSVLREEGLPEKLLPSSPILAGRG